VSSAVGLLTCETTWRLLSIAGLVAAFVLSVPRKGF